MTITWDAEWRIDTGDFRCATWIDHGNEELMGTRSAYALAKEIPKHTLYIGHNITSDLKKCVHWGIPLPKEYKIVDTLLLARMLHPLWPAKDLKSVARMYGYPLVDLHAVENEAVLLDYCGKDTYVTHKLWEILSQEFSQQQRVAPRVMGLNFEFAKAFMMLELAGMKLDREFLLAEQQRLDSSLLAHMKDVQDPQLLTKDELLFTRLQEDYNIKILDKFLGSKDGYSMKQELLVMLPQPPTWLSATLAAREEQKYKTLYVDNVLAYGDYVQPNFSILMTKTHRRSTSPTIQNWPGAARRAVVSRFPGGQVIEGDMRNLEARITGVQSVCKQFVKDMVKEGYLGVAARTLGIEKLTDKNDPRYVEIKSTVLAITYHMSPGLFAYREWVQAKGKKKKRKWADVEKNVYKPFFSAYPEIEEEISRRMEYGQHHGYTDTWCDAHVQLPIPNYEWIERSALAPLIEKLRGKIDNFSINWPTQQFASYVTGGALVDLIRMIVEYYFEGHYGLYAAYCYRSRSGGVGNRDSSLAAFRAPVVVGEVHDSIVIDCPKSEVKRVTQFLHDAMTQGHSLRKIAPAFPQGILDVEINVSNYWTKT